MTTQGENDDTEVEQERLRLLNFFSLFQLLFWFCLFTVALQQF